MVNVEGDRIVGVEPFERDPRLSPLTDSITEAVHADNRVARPGGLVSELVWSAMVPILKE